MGCGIHNTHFVTLVMAVLDCVCEQKGAELLRMAEVLTFAGIASFSRSACVVLMNMYGAFDCKSCNI